MATKNTTPKKASKNKMLRKAKKLEATKPLALSHTKSFPPTPC
jgi:hypothetical protein